MFPLEVVRRRMQTLAAAGMSQRGVMVARQAVLDIWAKERLRGFYAGMLPNTVQVRLPASALRAALGGVWMRVSRSVPRCRGAPSAPDTHPRDPALSAITQA